ncbi:MAG: hypothetical protein JWM98_2927 [Thermoleophilia bacterium]|nr:hypothetical protein [Thermoleophilia bacterium]
MAASTKTKAMFALGALDIARQVTKAWSAKQEAERDKLGFGKGLREDVSQLADNTRRLARDTRDRLPDGFDWRSMPPWHRQPTRAERMKTWAPVAVVIALTSAVVVVVAHLIAREDDTLEPDKAVKDSRMTGAIKAGSEAIDAGVTKVVQGGSAAATGTASVLAAGSSAVKTATVQRAKVELDHRVVAPAKKKAVLYGTLGVIGLTVYVIIIAVAVQLIVNAF